MQIQEKINKLIKDYNRQKIVGFDIDAENIEDLKTNSGFMFYLNENADSEVVDFIFEQKFLTYFEYLSFKNISANTLRKWHSHFNNSGLEVFVKNAIKVVVFKNPVLFEKFKPILAEKRLKLFN